MYDFLELSELIIERIEDILNEFAIDYEAYEDRLQMPCPIHGGDNPEGMSILTRGVGRWQCFTHDCQEDYKDTIIGFVQALLTTQNNKKYSLPQAAEWAANFVGLKPKEEGEVKIDHEKNKFIQLHKFITKKPDRTSSFFTIDMATKGLEIPAQYYIDRGYEPETLTKYKIGFCSDPNKSMFNRVVVPCFDDTGDYCIGYSGRSIYDKCPICKYHHPQGKLCPGTRQEKVKLSKWKHSTGLAAERFFYNYCFAKKHILETGKVILVEGPGCIWRLEEAGVHIGLACLGAKFTDEQKLILECSGAMTLILALDMDEAGQKNKRNIIERCKNMFNIVDLELPQKDLGDMTTEEVKKLFDGRL